MDVLSSSRTHTSEDTTPTQALAAVNHAASTGPKSSVHGDTHLAKRSICTALNAAGFLRSSHTRHVLCKRFNRGHWNRLCQVLVVRVQAGWCRCHVLAVRVLVHVLQVQVLLWVQVLVVWVQVLVFVGAVAGVVQLQVWCGCRCKCAGAMCWWCGCGSDPLVRLG